MLSPRPSPNGITYQLVSLPWYLILYLYRISLEGKTPMAQRKKPDASSWNPLTWLGAGKGKLKLDDKN